MYHARQSGDGCFSSLKMLHKHSAAHDFNTTIQGMNKSLLFLDLKHMTLCDTMIHLNFLQDAFEPVSTYLLAALILTSVLPKHFETKTVSEYVNFSLELRSHSNVIKCQSNDRVK